MQNECKCCRTGEKHQQVLHKNQTVCLCASLNPSVTFSIFACIWDLSVAAAASNHSHQSKGSLVQKTWPSEAKIYQRLAAFQPVFSAFSWAPASLQAGASPTGCSGRFIFPALLLYWMGSVKLKGWSTMLTLPRWWVQFAHGSSVLKIFASKVLWSISNESIHQMADFWGGRSGSAPHDLLSSLLTLRLCWSCEFGDLRPLNWIKNLLNPVKN